MIRIVSKQISVSILVIGFLLSTAVIPTAYNQVSAATKSTSNYKQYYSWAGLKIFKTGVLGWYDTNGKKVTSFGKVYPKHSTGLAWSSTNETAAWTSKKNTSQAKAYSQAKFVLGIATSQFSIGLQSVTKGITATGKP
ncbi:putative secreted protein [Caldibacillus thermoamylovorans]|uniref:Putative secreted protein n=1 Tax=Caldibacillus thermoamylovorans TaxID=35841 RepID=A0A090J2U5_9BACI|nr:hypothetical protein [Caldibacillus thermoamylovorans]CEE02968.1 putative secreted protein [Caldibacillus thermoamylovorans]